MGREWVQSGTGGISDPYGFLIWTAREGTTRPITRHRCQNFCGPRRLGLISMGEGMLLARTGQRERPSAGAVSPLHEARKLRLVGTTPAWRRAFSTLPPPARWGMAAIVLSHLTLHAETPEAVWGRRQTSLNTQGTCSRIDESLWLSTSMCLGGSLLALQGLDVCLAHLKPHQAKAAGTGRAWNATWREGKSMHVTCDDVEGVKLPTLLHSLLTRYHLKWLGPAFPSV